ncbi:MAG: hypothetical protein U0Q18_23205 [Bryobacteraceae bacterium]
MARAVVQYLLVAGCALLTAGVEAQTNLPGTAPLVFQGDPAADMVDAIRASLVRETVTAAEHRDERWHRDFSSPEAYERSISGNRENLRRIIGAVDARGPVSTVQLETTTDNAAELAVGRQFRVFAVRWPVFEDVIAEGLLLQPEATPRARVVAIPDADWTPEMLAGLTLDLPPAAQFARRLAEHGVQVLIPTLIDRKDTWSGIPGIRMTNLPHREWIYRMAYETGRHIIGYEVQEVMAGVDWFEHENAKRRLPIAVAGYGEGGLLALYSAALDPRIQHTLVSGYFQPRQELWKEPIYRDVWGLLNEFGDAELAGMVAPRRLVVEASRFPPVPGPPPASPDRKGAASGSLANPDVRAVRDEVERARRIFSGLRAATNLEFAGGEDGNGMPGSDAAVSAFLKGMGIAASNSRQENTPVRRVRTDLDTTARQHRLFDAWVAHTQAVIRRSDQQRRAFWAKADASTAERWKNTTATLRKTIWEDLIGRMPDPSVPANPRTRLIYDEPAYRGYEVMLDVWPGIYAYGILLVPKNLRTGEKRPVVVCQHGLEGRPVDVIEGKQERIYGRFAARLAEQGFITYAPQNPYIGEDRFRLIQRQAHPLKLSLFSFILGQHQRLLEWLGALPFVDPGRIAFYGLSYGGKTAVRVPPLLDGYALSICSADFNQWIWKNTSIDAPYSYLLTSEYDMLEYDFAEMVNYSDLANLMAPRPFMVERGHDDGVAPDEWVAYEYAKVRRFYDKMGIPDRTTIEFFNGPHSIHGVGTFDFLKQQLK